MSTQQASPLAQLSEIGVSVWLDDLSRDRLSSGELRAVVENSFVTGVTTNPTIFAHAVSHSDAYEQPLRELAREGVTAEDAVLELMCRDVQDACDLLEEVYVTSSGYDGRVSIEVPPSLAHNADETVIAARTLWRRIDRPNLLIKVPATPAGLVAITALLAEGISVNVTLIFSLQRYREVINAYFTGLERARAAGHDLSGIHSVASFFVSRLDTAVDAQLRAIGSQEALQFCGTAAIANARLAYEIFVQSIDSERAIALQAFGANLQRPLWASTGVKDPALADTLYVTELAGPHVVNTMPEGTLLAVADHAILSGNTLTGLTNDANTTLNSIEHLGLSYAETVLTLEAEGLAKFEQSYEELLDIARKAITA
jgi:transaldolase